MDSLGNHLCSSPIALLRYRGYPCLRLYRGSRRILPAQVGYQRFHKW